MLASATLNSSLGSQIAGGNRDRDLVAAALSLLTRIDRDGAICSRCS
jgi:hypothetical protein